jgi:hypothetical protein
LIAIPLTPLLIIDIFSPLAPSADCRRHYLFSSLSITIFFRHFRFDIGYDDYFAAILLTRLPPADGYASL